MVLLEMTVTETKIEVNAETEKLSLYLTSYGRSNNEENPSQWSYGDVAASLTGFNFTSDGWVQDEDGITVLRVGGDARVEIPVQMFAQDFRGTGKTIEVEFHGIGGHAFGAFGQVANPLHAAARAIAKIADLKVPAYPKTTYCVSNFHAGNDAGIHAIVPYASIKINYRSNGQAELEALDKEIMRCIDEACKEETDRWGQDTITYNITTFCDVRAGSLGEHDPIVEATWAGIEYLGYEPELLKGGPTNASIPIGNGVPAVCLGNGGPEIYCHNAAMERFPVKDTYQLPQLALLVTLAVAGIAGETKTILK